MTDLQSNDPAVAQATRKLASYVVSATPKQLSQRVRHEGLRTFLNWTGCAVGSSGHEAVAIAIKSLLPFCGPPQASILGRAERADVLHAALFNGISSHVFDFDDTHLKTIIHPAGPVASAILALAEYHLVSGAEFLNSLVLGVEVECRIGNAVSPEHYDIGWYISGTTGAFGAAAAAGKLLGLDEQQMAWAIGLAATQPTGLREMFGTMTKSFHPGRAAQNGLTAALLAEGGYTSSEHGIEAQRGWAHVLSTRCDNGEITDGLGMRYEALRNTYKPFACGIVIHPAIDGCIRIRNEHHLTADSIKRIELKVHPLVLELTGKREPQTGLDGRFSVYHAVATAVIHGEAGPEQFSDAAVRDVATVRLRDSVSTSIDAAIAKDAAHVVVLLKDGRRLEKAVEHAVGSEKRPMTDDELNGKFDKLVAPVLGEKRAAELRYACWSLEQIPDVSQIARLAAGS